MDTVNLISNSISKLYHLADSVRSVVLLSAYLYVVSLFACLPACLLLLHVVCLANLNVCNCFISVLLL